MLSAPCSSIEKSWLCTGGVREHPPRHDALGVTRLGEPGTQRSTWNENSDINLQDERENRAVTEVSEGSS